MRIKDLERLVDELLVRDADTHAEALDAITAASDRRAVPYLVRVLTIHEVGNNWEQFGFLEALQEHSLPRHLELPEARWLGVRETPRSVAEPNYDSIYVWVESKSWYSQRDIVPLKEIVDEIHGRDIVLLRETTDEVTVYEALSIPLERDEDVPVDDDGCTGDSLQCASR